MGNDLCISYINRNISKPVIERTEVCVIRSGNRYDVIHRNTLTIGHNAEYVSYENLTITEISKNSVKKAVESFNRNEIKPCEYYGENANKAFNCAPVIIRAPTVEVLINNHPEFFI